MPVEADVDAALGKTIFRGRCEVGAFSYFNYGVQVMEATIGRFCSIGQESMIGMGMHPVGYLTTHPINSDPSGIASGLQDNAAYKTIACTRISKKEKPATRVAIGHDVWIGARAIVMPGVTIGIGAIVAAGAVVTHDVEPFSIVAGVPARHLRYRLPQALRDRVLASVWWDRDLSLMEVRDYSDPETFLDELERVDPFPYGTKKEHTSELVVSEDHTEV